MVERITGPTPVPSLRNCTGRLTDGDTVPQPHRPEPAPTRRQLVWGWLCAGLVLALMAVGVLREAFSTSGYPDWFWKGLGWITRLTALTLVCGLYAVDPTTTPLW